MNKTNDELRFGLALKEARMIKGLSQEELALESELDRSYISMLEREIKNPTLATISKISKALGLSPVDLVTRSQQFQYSIQVKNKKDKKIKIPLFGTSVSCGRPLLHDYTTDQELSLDEELIKDPKNTFFIKASGDSMQPIIWDGDIVIITKGLIPHNGSIVLAQIENDLTIKRYFKTSKGTRLSPENHFYQDIVVHDETEGMICGIVTGIARKIK